MSQRLLYLKPTKVLFIFAYHCPPTHGLYNSHRQLDMGVVLQRIEWIQHAQYKSIPTIANEMRQIIQTLLLFQTLLNCDHLHEMHTTIQSLQKQWIQLERQMLRDRFNIYYCHIPTICKQYHILLERVSRSAKKLQTAKRLKLTKYRCKMPHHTKISHTIDETRLCEWLSVHAWETHFINQYMKTHFASKTYTLPGGNSKTNVQHIIQQLVDALQPPSTEIIQPATKQH